MRLPVILESFLRAVQKGDYAALSATMSEEAVLIEDHNAYTGTGIRAWLGRVVLRGGTALRPMHKARKHDQMVLTILSDQRTPQGEDLEVRNNWTFTLKGDRICTVMIEYAPAPVLPPIVDEYVRATNRFDLEGLLATFHPDALVNDQLHEYRGRDAIRQWAERTIIGERLTMCVVDAIERHGNVVVTANVDGNFDKRGLPDPLVLAFYFSVTGDQIVQLIILHNLPWT